ncbi:MAG: phosphotransferase [Planctomycetes bacterium]|nr:phosphotransferase [Planctomycetota bacterium]
MTSHRASDLSRIQGEILLLSRTVRSQIDRAAKAFVDRDRDLAQDVIERDDYVDNVFRRIEQETVTGICVNRSEEDRRRLVILRTVGQHLEAIADNAENLAKQAIYLANQSAQPLVVALEVARDLVVTGLVDAVEGFLAEDLASVEWANRCENGVDHLYDEAFGAVLERVGKGNRAGESFITQLFAMKALERMSDQILDIAEATIFLVTGDNIRIRQYLRMSEIVGAPDAGAQEGLATIWNGRSGILVSHVLAHGEDLIFKEGTARKIVEEIESAKRWEEIAPGSVPRIHREEVTDGRATLVTEYIRGPLYRDLLIGAQTAGADPRTGELLALLGSIWEATLREGPAPIDYVTQIRRRLPLLFAAHPGLQGWAERPDAGVPPLEDLLDRLARGEAGLAAPFTVWIHGDLNNDNIIFDLEAKRFRFIDIHRSRYGDYLQDVSILLLSNRRSPEIEREAAEVARRANEEIFAFGRRFAEAHGDERFEARLQLGLGRASITSARFLEDFAFARVLFLEGVEHLARAAAHLGT